MYTLFLQIGSTGGKQLSENGIYEGPATGLQAAIRQF